MTFDIRHIWGWACTLIVIVAVYWYLEDVKRDIKREVEIATEAITQSAEAARIEAEWWKRSEEEWKRQDETRFAELKGLLSRIEKLTLDRLVKEAQ